MTEPSGLTAGLKADLASTSADMEQVGREVIDSARSRFETAITELRAAGLSQVTLEQIVQAGATGLLVAEGIVRGGRERP